LDVVIDANVLFRILITGGDIVEVVFDPSLRIFAPERLKAEFLKHKNELIEKTALEGVEFDAVSSLLFSRIEFISLEEYKYQLQKAKAMLSGHNKDEDFLALCFAKECKFWVVCQS